MKCGFNNVESPESLSYSNIMFQNTGRTNVNLLYFPESIEIATLEGLTLWCSEINQSKWPLAW